MANLNFFATREDLFRIFEFLFARTTFRIFDSYSDFGQELREYKTPVELLEGYDYEFDPNGPGNWMLLKLWSPKVMPDPVIERIELIPEKCDGFTFRYSVRGFGVAQLYLGGVCKETVVSSHFGHFTERRARRNGYESGVDWESLEIQSKWLRSYVGRTLAVAKAPGHAILAGAYQKFLEGFALKQAPTLAVEYKPNPILVRRKAVPGITLNSVVPIRDSAKTTRHQEQLARKAIRDEMITDRRCPACGQPCPKYRRTCKRCGLVVARAAT